ncbi:16S rRNA (uracil(1498)-N(3))-methyltransferase [Paenibacillus sp. GSMTC-2017]|uniref:RsmE family RNA methyltransferase n=1 Tax=Paenibacillus sp. GSMTC-2017 TaxID=2794350 RepID=UPI0018D5D7F1|nr:RsmE family RNA methyltransferase [Paenibacillus sp. GSMTC-2017]MBH5318147.1 16S rRNA (uracil(1498)-N(3))-methyltransferase [Paenibacillus sp. GSMTC-2017]
MQRYFVAPEQFRDGAITITGEDAHHAARVMRMKPDEEIIVCDGAGRSVKAVVIEVSPLEIRAKAIEVLAQDSEPAWQITIAQGLPKGDKMELVIQKGTEIGASSFVPFESERVIVQYDGKKEAKRIERWGKIAKEAAEQAHRHTIPTIESVKSWRQMLATIEQYDLALFCYEREGADAHGRGIAKAVREWKASRNINNEFVQDDVSPRILLMVGPEGGFSEREAVEVEAAGAVLVGLGKRILRTETAGLVGLTCLLYESGEMEGA